MLRIMHRIKNKQSLREKEGQSAPVELGNIADLGIAYIDDPDRRFVTALARGLELLRCFKSGENYLGNIDFAKRTGIPKPTVSRLTYTLTRLGYLTYLDELGKYGLGINVLSLGYSFLSNLDMRQIARPWMQELADYSRVAVSMGIRDRMSMVYVETCRSSASITLRLDIGSRIPMSTTAMGRAFICALPEEERVALLESIKTENELAWPKIKQGIDEAAQWIKTKGFCLAYNEWRNDIGAVGVSFIDPRDNKVMAFTCGGPSFILTKEALEQDIGPRLLECIENMGKTLK